MAEVWFVRHGESTSNAGQRTSDTTTVELTELGWRQAHAASLIFPKAPDLVVVTPYLRTRQTAAPTLARFPSARCEMWPLQEFSSLAQTTYANKTSAERAPFVQAYWDRRDENYVDGPGAESFSQMTARIKEAFEKLKSAPESFIVVFTHGHIMRALRFLIEKPSMTDKELVEALPRHAGKMPVENCAVIKARAHKNGIMLHPQDRALFEAQLKDVKPPSAPPPKSPPPPGRR